MFPSKFKAGRGAVRPELRKNSQSGTDGATQKSQVGK